MPAEPADQIAGGPDNEVDGNGSDERDEHEAAVHGLDWKLVVGEISRWLREKAKYGNDFQSVDEVLKACREELLEAIDSRGLDWEGL